MLVSRHLIMLRLTAISKKDYTGYFAMLGEAALARLQSGKRPTCFAVNHSVAWWLWAEAAAQ